MLQNPRARGRLICAPLLGFCLLAFGAIAQAPGDIRVALVIGNGAYTSAPSLPNPSNDAQAMGNALRKIGFTVIELRDGSKTQMAEAIVKVRDTLKGKQGVGMLYYAGHGLQMDARNFMVPVNARMSKAADIPGQTVDVGSVIDAFKAAGNRMNILVLDACRDNPFGGIASGKGLAPLDAPSGTFLAYATAPGNVAEDGDVKTGNGLYTQFLLQELAKPQASIENVFKRVRFAVRKASNGRQIPWESTSLEDDFQFNDGRVVALAKPTAQALQNSYNEEKVLWDRIKSSSNPDDFYAFLERYPNGTLTEAAQGRLNILTKPSLVVQGAGPDGKDRAYFTARFKLGDEYEVRGGTGSMSIIERYKVSQISTSEVAVEGLLEYKPGSAPAKLTLFFTPDGASLGNSAVRFDLPQYPVPGGLLQVGQQWPIAYSSSGGAGNTVATGDGRVLAREKITTPAGTYDTFKVQNTLQMTTSGQKTDVVVNVWLTPDLPTYVRSETKMNGALINTAELVRFLRP